MSERLNKIIKILFSYQTDSVSGKTNQNILLCQEGLHNFLESFDIHCELDFYSLGKKKENNEMHANLVAFNPNSKGPFILLQGHIDTAPSFVGHKIIINKKEIKGRGAVDMKGSLAGMVNAFIDIYHEKHYNYSPILLITADEEANSFAGISNFIKKRKKIVKLTKLAINGEPTDFSVCTAFKGIFGCIIEKSGKEGHSAYPGKGTIIENMIPLINAINEFISSAKKIKNKKFGSTDGAFTVINSGKKINQLPGNFLTGFSLRTVKSTIKYKNLFEKLVTKNIPRGSKIRYISIDPICTEISPDQHYVLKKSFLEIEKNMKEGVAKYFSEANILNREGVTTITCGPGNPKLAHVDPKKETIKIIEIKKYSELLKKIFKNINQND